MDKRLTANLTGWAAKITGTIEAGQGSGGYGHYKNIKTRDYPMTNDSFAEMLRGVFDIPISFLEIDCESCSIRKRLKFVKFLKNKYKEANSIILKEHGEELKRKKAIQDALTCRIDQLETELSEEREAVRSMVTLVKLYQGWLGPFYKLYE